MSVLFSEHISSFHHAKLCPTLTHIFSLFFYPSFALFTLFSRLFFLKLSLFLSWLISISLSPYKFFFFFFFFFTTHPYLFLSPWRKPLQPPFHISLTDDSVLLLLLFHVVVICSRGAWGTDPLDGEERWFAEHPPPTAQFVVYCSIVLAICKLVSIYLHCLSVCVCVCVSLFFSHCLPSLCFSLCRRLVRPLWHIRVFFFKKKTKKTKKHGYVTRGFDRVLLLLFFCFFFFLFSEPVCLHIVIFWRNIPDIFNFLFLPVSVKISLSLSLSIKCLR